MAQWILVVANVVLVLITGTYVILTHRLAVAGERSAAASEQAALSAASAARASHESVEVQRASVAIQRASQGMNFVIGGAGPFDSGFGFVLRTDGGSYFVREVSLQNITFKSINSPQDAGFTYGTDQVLTPSGRTLPSQLDAPDHLTFEVTNAATLGQGALGGKEWTVTGSSQSTV